ncbi:Glucuronosyltransferase [Aphelenchoides fujianensis]|nr:Glucuronosyltransferase [Aphelenchoides fujianensis]
MPSSLFPVHRQTMEPLAAELVRRGHKVTWFEYGLKKPEIPLPSEVEEIFVQVSTPSQKIRDIYEHRNHSVHKRVWEDDFSDEAAQSSAWLASVELCDRLLSDRTQRAQFEKLVARRFDAVVLDDLYNPCGLFHTGLQHSIFVYWSMTGMRTESAWAHHSPSPPSYIPVPGTGLTDELDFWERTTNLAAYLRALYVHQHVILRRIDALAEKHFPGKLTETFYLERNASINFVNHPPIFDFARPYMPRVNFVGGLHCHKPKPLTKELETFVKKATTTDGFVVISSGRSQQWKHAPSDVITNLLQAIAAKPNIQFVWQYDGPALKSPPANLLVKPSGHEKCKAHISHGGLNSVIESMWHGVPVVGWPLTASGKDNLLRVTARHAGIMLEHKRPTKNQFISAINRIYDMLIDVPLNHAAFWVEFIVRHQEVPHARSGADELNILSYFLVDVIAFLLSGAIVALTLTYYAFKFFFRLLFLLVAALLPKKQRVDEKKKKN